MIAGILFLITGIFGLIKSYVLLNSFFPTTTVDTEETNVDKTDPMDNYIFLFIVTGFFALYFIGCYIVVKLFSLNLLIILMSIQVIFIVTLCVISGGSSSDDE